MALSVFAQFPQGPPDEPEPKRLPNGKLQTDEIIKADHEANRKDIEKMRKLMDDVDEELKKNKGLVVSLKSIKDLEEIEKITKRMRTRMKRY